MVDTQILILNWNNWPDTIECLKSVLYFSEARITLVDNNSTDNSISSIKSFLENTGISHTIISLQEIASLNNKSEKVVLVQSPENYGFAGGNNRIMEVVQKDESIKYIWLLNNDAFAVKDSLKALKQKMDEDEKIAFAGSVILDGTNRSLIQCCGVKYYKYFGVAKLIMKDEVWNDERKKNIPYSDIAFQNGASLLIRNSALKDIGLMDERFFLYSEEHDWQYRAEKKGYKNVLAANSIIYHKGSVSTNSKKHLFFYYYNKSSVIFSRKHHSIFVNLIATILLTGVTLVRTKLNIKSFSWGMKGIKEGWFVSVK